MKLFVDYKLPQTLLGKFAEPFLVRANEREADFVLSNLEERIEA